MPFIYFRYVVHTPSVRFSDHSIFVRLMLTTKQGKAFGAPVTTDKDHKKTVNKNTHQNQYNHQSFIFLFSFTHEGGEAKVYCVQ